MTNHLIHSFAIYCATNSFDIWTVISALCSVTLVFIGYYQLKSLADTSKADFIHKFKEDFFTDNTNSLLELIDRQKIKYVDTGDKDSYFKNLDTKTNKRKKYSTYEMDYLVLGHLEDLGAFEKKGIIDIGMIYELFDYYIEICWKNPEIQKYIGKGDRGEGDIYSNFRYLYKKCKSLA